MKHLKYLRFIENVLLVNITLFGTISSMLSL